METTLRAAQPGEVTAAGNRALKKAFGRISRETQMLLRWLRFTHLEQRNQEHRTTSVTSHCYRLCFSLVYGTRQNNHE